MDFKVLLILSLLFSVAYGDEEDCITSSNDTENEPFTEVPTPDAEMIDWMKAGELVLNMNVAVLTKDQKKLEKGIRDLIRMLPQKDALYSVGFEWEDMSVKVMKQSFWEGQVYELFSSPFWNRISQGGFYLGLDKTQDNRDITGIVYVSTPTEVTHEKSKYTKLKASRKIPDNVYAVYTVGEGKFQSNMKEIKSKCDELMRNRREIESLLDKVSGGIILLPDEMYCPSKLREIVNSYYVLSIGTTYYKDGTPIEYISSADEQVFQ